MGKICQENHIRVDADCSDLMVSVVSVTSNVHPAKPGATCSENGSEVISSVNEVQPMEVGTAEKISDLDDVQSTKVETVVLRATASSDIAGKSIPTRYFSRENYDSIANLDQIMDVSYPLRELLGEQVQKPGGFY